MQKESRYLKLLKPPKATIIPDLTVDEAIYILLFADINDDGEFNIPGVVITEPIGGFGISPESSKLTPLTIIEGMETINIIIYHPEEIFGTYGEIPLGIEPLGIYGATPGNPEPTAINTSQDTTGLDITIYNITELYGNYVSTISGTVTIDKNKYYR